MRMGYEAHLTGGMPDHIHTALGCQSIFAVAKVVCSRIKGASSK